MTAMFRDKVVVVTGAASGIGRATTAAFVDRGAKVWACDVDEAGLGRLEDQHAGRVHVHRADVSRKDDVRAFRDVVERAEPAVDVLVNNAGVGLAGDIRTTTLEDWEWIVGVNLWGVIHGCHYFLPRMIDARAGHVVNVSSVLGYVGAPDVLAYSTTKFAVFGLSESLRAELSRHDVGVSVICPGIVNTNIVKTTRYRMKDPDGMKRRIVGLYDRRNYKPEGVAKAIVDAVQHKRDVVPVTPEAWALYYTKRLSPRLSRALGQRGARRSLG